MSRSWYAVALARSDKTVAEVSMDGPIGAFGIPASEFRAELAGLGDVKQINLRINSPGGEVFDGIAVHNILARSKSRVVATIDGLAASIASLVPMAADRVIMPENAMMMVHNPSGLVFGTADDMGDMADALNKFRDGMVTSYVAKTKQTEDKIKSLMAAETWLSAKEAKELGFADEVAPPRKVTAFFDLSNFRNPPKEPTAMTTKKPDDSNAAAEAEAQAKKDAEALAAARALVAKADEAKAKAAETAAAGTTSQAPDSLVAERERAANILAACEMAGHTELAAGFIKDNKTLTQVLAELKGVPRGKPDSSGNGGRELSNRHSNADPDSQKAVTASWDKHVNRINASR